MKTLPQKIITCILPKGVAVCVIEKLRDTYGLISANIKSARGVGKITPLAYRGVGGQSEKEILTVVVPTESADELFEFIYETAEINRPHGGLIYMNALSMATIFTLPELPPEK